MFDKNIVALIVVLVFTKQQITLSNVKYLITTLKKKQKIIFSVVTNAGSVRQFLQSIITALPAMSIPYKLRDLTTFFLSRIRRLGGLTCQNTFLQHFEMITMRRVRFWMPVQRRRLRWRAAVCRE